MSNYSSMTWDQNYFMNSFKLRTLAQVWGTFEEPDPKALAKENIGESAKRLRYVTLTAEHTRVFQHDFGLIFLSTG